MDAELRTWLVLVRAGIEGRYAVATGFPITERHVLTALHVLVGEEHVGVPLSGAALTRAREALRATPIIMRLPHQDREKDYPADVVWDGLDSGLDAVVLVARDNHDAPQFGRRGLVAHRPARADTRWQSEAWPAGAITSQPAPPTVRASRAPAKPRTPPAPTVKQRDSEPMLGDVMGEVLPPQRLQKLEIHADFFARDDWRGASGSPVFVYGAIVGILASYSTRRERTFQAVPMVHLLANAGFRETTGLGRSDVFLANVTKQAMQLLERTRDVSEAFVEAIANFLRALDKAPSLTGFGPSSAIKAALEMTWTDFADICDGVHDDFVERGREREATVVVELLDLVLPAVADRGLVASLRRSLQGSGAILFLPPVNETVAHLLIAAAHEARAHLEGLPDPEQIDSDSSERSEKVVGRFVGKDPKRGKLPVLPELGMVSPDEEVDKVVKHLWGFVPADLRQGVSNPAKMADLINKQLKHWKTKARERRVPYYLYWRQPNASTGVQENFRRESAEVVASRLKARLPELCVVGVDDHYAANDDDLLLLNVIRDIFERTPKKPRRR